MVIQIGVIGPVIALKGGWKIKDKNSMSGLNFEREARGALK